MDFLKLTEIFKCSEFEIFKFFIILAFLLLRCFFSFVFFDTANELDTPVAENLPQG